MRRPLGRGTVRALGGLAALGLALAGGAAVLAMTPGVPATDPPGTGRGAAADQSVVDAGRSLFTANCASCHGPQGQGAAAGPSLVGVGAASADFYLRTGRMPLSAPGQRVVRQAPHFDEAGIDALVAYVASLGPGPSVPQVAGGGDIRKGWALFQANCAACHNATGAGNAVGGGFVAVGLGQADPTTVGEATIIGPGAMPAFAFDPASLADLAAYVRWLRDAPTPGGAAIGQTGPVAEGFVGVAVGLPLLLLVSVFVARRGGGAEPRTVRRHTGTDDTGDGTRDATEDAAADAAEAADAADAAEVADAADATRALADATPAATVADGGDPADSGDPGAPA